jgi:hypothetical protein
MNSNIDFEDKPFSSINSDTFKASIYIYFHLDHNFESCLKMDYSKESVENF